MIMLNKYYRDESCESSGEDRNHNEELADMFTYDEKLAKILSDEFNTEPEKETLSENSSVALYSFLDLSKNELLKFLKEHQNFEFELRDSATGEYVWVNDAGQI